MLNARLTVNNELGLHARAAAYLVKGVAPFQSAITLCRLDIDRKADAKSILSVLTLAASKGTQIEIAVDGPDEAAALSAIERAFETGFGELSGQTASE